MSQLPYEVFRDRGGQTLYAKRGATLPPGDWGTAKAARALPKSVKLNPDGWMIDAPQIVSASSIARRYRPAD